MKKWIIALALAGLATSGLAAKDKPMQIAAKGARPVMAPVAPQPTAVKLPPPEAMIIMIRSSLVALSQANLTNNYAVLSSLGSSNFRAANPPQRLGQVFESFRANRIDLNPVVFVTPQLTTQPVIQNGRLRLTGYFPTAPMRVNYDLQFEPDQGQWKLFSLGVNLDRAQGVPVAAPAPAKAPQGR
jgi:hypothetical protein